MSRLIKKLSKKDQLKDDHINDLMNLLARIRNIKEQSEFKKTDVDFIFYGIVKFIDKYKRDNKNKTITGLSFYSEIVRRAEQIKIIDEKNYSRVWGKLIGGDHDLY